MRNSKYLRPAILSACLLLLVIGGVRHVFGIFLPPITAEFGWGREVFSLGFALQMFLLGFAGPVGGYVADRFGPGRVLAFGAVLHAIGLYGISLTVTPLGFLLSAGVLIGLGASGVSNVIVIGAVSRLVDDAVRSRVVGVLMAGFSLGQILMLPLAHYLIANHGWSRAMVVLAVMVLGVLPLILVIIRPGAGGAANKPTLRMQHALRQAGGHRGFLLLNTGYFVCGFHIFFIATHLPAYIQDQGLSPGVGTTALMLVGIFNMGGSYLWGFLGDRYPMKRLLGLIYLLRAILIALFISFPTTLVSVYLFAAGIGFLWLATVPLTAGLVGRIFGLQYLSMLYGIVFMSHQAGGFLGAWMAGWLFDLTGSYQLMWSLAIVLGLVAALVHQPIDDSNVEDAAGTRTGQAKHTA